MTGNIWGGVLTVTGFIACPCHLPFTIPLFLSILGGTVVGGFVAANTYMIYGFATGYFLLGVGVGLYLLNRKKRNDKDDLGEIPLHGLAASEKR